MNVCNVWENFWPLQFGGLEHYILSLTNYLNKNKQIDFSLITGRSKILMVPKKIKKLEDAGFIKVYRLGPTPADILSGVVYEAFDSTPQIIKNMRFAALCHEAAKSNVAKSADIFHVHGIWGLSDLEYAQIGLYLSQHFHKPLIVTLHGGFIGDPLIGGMPLDRPEIKTILDSAEAITTYSQEAFVFLEHMGLGKKSHLVKNFVDTNHFVNSSVTKKGKTVTFVSRLETPQTPDLVVEAFKEVTARIPDAKLQIVGYGSMVEYLNRQISDCHLENNVFMMGKQTDVRKFLWDSDVFVSTNFGYIAALEAWSAGLAVVAPNFGVLKETVTHGFNGLLVPPKDSHMLAVAIIDILENRALLNKLASNGQQTARANYDVRAVAPKISAIYDSVLHK